jgi:alcohol dehydrogenase
VETSFYFPNRLSNFFSPNKIMLSAGASGAVGTEAKALGGKRAVVVTDPGMMKTGLVEGIRESLSAQRIETVLYDRAELETPARVIDECAEFAKREQCNIVIGFGGGTVLDTTKGVSLMAANEGKVLDYAGIDLVPRKGLSKIMIPTTAGSGSEVTRVFAVTDEAERTKKVVYTSYNLADVVILDPLLTLGLPPGLTSETGIDALAHAIESYVSVNATPFSDVLAIEAVRLVGKSLLPAYAKGETVEARFDMLLAATIAGLSWASGGLGGAHALSYVLESEWDLGHGKAVSIMLPHVMTYNKIGAIGKYALIAQALGERVEGKTASEAADLAIAAVKGLLETMNISTRLSAYGISQDDLPKLVTGTMKQTRLFAPNPRTLTEQDVKDIYLGAL